VPFRRQFFWLVQDALNITKHTLTVQQHAGRAVLLVIYWVRKGDL
jgi:hypothetical protein